MDPLASGVVETRVDPPASRHFAELGAGTQFEGPSTAIVPAPEKRTLLDTDDDDFSEDDAWGRREMLQITYKKPKVAELKEKEPVHYDSDRKMAADSEFASLEEELPEPCIETSDKFIEREFSKIANITPKQLDYMDNILNKTEPVRQGQHFLECQAYLLRRVAPIINDPDNNRQVDDDKLVDKTFANMSDAEFKGGYFDWKFTTNATQTPPQSAIPSNQASWSEALPIDHVRPCSSVPLTSASTACCLRDLAQGTRHRVADVHRPLFLGAQGNQQ